MIRSCLRFAALSLAFVCGFTSLHAQSALASLRPVAQNNRIAANPDLGPQLQLTGHLPGWVSKGTPLAKPVNLSNDMYLTIVLQRDPAVQATFVKFLDDQQTPGNPLYHQWLTPQQVGTMFGPTSSDLGAVTNWLSAQGLTIDSVAPNQVMINVHGATSAVASAFRTSFAYFTINGEAHISAVNEPTVPAALAPVMNNIFGLTDVPVYPTYYRSGPNQMPAAGSATTPQPLYTTSSGTHYMTPGDFAIVYDVNSVYTGGNKGGGTVTSSPGHSKANSVAVIGRSYVSVTDISEFAALTGIGSSYVLNQISPTVSSNPGAVCTYANANTCSTSGDQGEQTLDVDRVVGNAPAATVDLIAASNSFGGIQLAAQYNVSTQLDPVMTISYGACEFNAGSVNVNTWDTLFSSGAAEGISSFVSSGDSAVNGCATQFTAVSGTYIASINYICASSYATCVGGTEFNDATGSYWGAAGGYVAPLTSVISYIPEGAWNEPGISAPYQTAGSGGGPSTIIAKPSWQTGTGVPADGHRDTPDVAYPAAQHDSYYACMDYALGSYAGQGNPPITSASNCTLAGGGYFFGFAGTSAAAPAMAGVTALLNAKTGTGQGNLNPELYTLAATTSNGVFHDVTVASSGVTSCSVTVPSMCNNSTPGSSALSTSATGGQVGYLVTAGYDEATGLGSIDVAKFLAAVSTAPAATFTVTPASLTYNLISGATTGNTDVITFASVNSFAGTVAYTCAATNGSGTAAGSCSLSPTSGTLAANGTGTSTLTITTTPGTSGVLNVKVTGTSGSTVVSSSTIAVTLTASSFTLTPLPTTLTLAAGATTGNTSVVTVTSVNGFAGTVTVGCATTVVSGSPSGTCAASPSTVTLTAGGTGTTTVTLTSTAGSGGVLTENISGSGSTTGATLPATATTAVTATLTVPTFTVVPATSTYNLTSGATTGNTDVFTLTSTNGFVGAVVTSCTVTNVSGTAAGSCVATTPVTLTSGGTGTSTVTITTTPGTSGALSVVVKGTSGTTVVTASTVTVNLTASSIATVGGAAISIAAGATSGTSTVALTSVNGFAGTVTLTCTPGTPSVTTAGTNTCTATPVTLTAGGTGTSNVTLTTVLGTSGTIALSYTATGTTAGATLSTSSTATGSASVTPPNFTLSAPSALNINPSGATTGNTTSSTVTSSAFAGTVNFTCTLAATSGSPANPATCAASSVTLTSGGNATTTITVTSTTAHGRLSGPQQAGLGGWGVRGGAMLAMLLCLVPFRRRRFVRPLAAFIVLAFGMAALSGCGGNGGAAVKSSSDGTYTGTLIGSGTSTGAGAAFSSNATFTVTITN